MGPREGKAAQRGKAEQRWTPAKGWGPGGSDAQQGAAHRDLVPSLPARNATTRGPGEPWNPAPAQRRRTWLPSAAQWLPGAQRTFRVLAIGAKNSQKTDLEYLSRL